MIWMDWCGRLRAITFLPRTELDSLGSYLIQFIRKLNLTFWQCKKLSFKKRLKNFPWCVIGMKPMIEIVSSLSILGKRTVKEVALYNFLSLRKNPQCKNSLNTKKILKEFQILGYHVKFTRCCISAVWSRPDRVFIGSLMYYMSH